MMKITKKILSLMLAVIMAVPVILAMPSTASAATVNSSVDEHLVAQYFTDSNLTADKSGNGFNLETVGSGMNWTSNDGVDCVKFPGGSNTNYFRVRTNEMLSGADMTHGLTITLRAKMSGSGWQRFFELSEGGGYGNGSTTSYVYLSPNESGTVRFKNTSYNNDESGKMSPGMDSSWHSYAVVIYNGFATIHKDGRYWARLDDSNRIKDTWLKRIKNGYLLLGASSYKDDTAFEGWLRDVRVYDTALNSVQLRLASTDANNNHAAVDVNYETSVDFHGNDGTTYSRNGTYYYSTTNPNYGVTRNSGAESFNNDDNMKYFRMWDKKDQLYYTDNSSRTEGMFQTQSDFRFDAWFGARNDTSGPYLIAIKNRNGGLPIQLLKNGNIKVNNTEITGVNAVYSGSNEKYHNCYTFSFDYSEQMLHFSAWGEYTDNNGNYNMQKTKDVKVTDYGLTLDPGDLAGINFLDASGNGHVRFGGVSFYTPKNPALTADKISAAKQYVKDNIAGFSKTSWENTFNAKAYHYSDEATNGFANVVWCPQGDDATWANDSNHDDGDYILYKFFLPKNIVLAYDGVNTPATPVTLEIKTGKNVWGTTQTRYVRTLFWDQDYPSTPFRNATYWKGYIDADWKNWPGEKTSDYAGNAQIGYAAGADSDYTVNNPNTSRFFWNKVNYQGGGNKTYHYYRFNDLQTNMYSSSKSNSGYSNKVKQANDNHNIYVIDYKPIYDKIDNLKAEYKKITDNGENYYTEDSLNQFYYSAYRFMTCTPNNAAYNYSADTLKAVNQCAADIDIALREYAKINLIRRADFSALDTAYSSANTKINQNPQAYTTTTLNSLRTVVNGLTYEPNDGTPYRPNMAYSDYQTAINNETTSVNNAISALKAVANFSELDSAYSSAKSAQSSLDSSLYTTSSVSAYNNFLNNLANFPYHERNNATRLDTPADPDQTNINTEKGTLTGAQANYLERRADFSALDEAKASWITFANSSEVTSSNTSNSVQALKDYVNSTSEFPLENAAVRADTGVSRNDDIEDEKDKYDNIKASDYLDPLADLTYFDAEYDKAKTFLMNLDGKTAEYTASSVQAVIDAVTAAGNAEGSNKSVETIANANAAARKLDFGQAVQADADDFADDIRDAMAGLKKASSVVPSTDTSAFEAAVEKLNNIDPDAYDVSEGDIASIRRSANATISSEETQKEYNGATINVLNGNVTQQDINDATSTILDALTVSTKKYAITKDAQSAEFTVSAKNGGYKEGSATYGTTIVADSGDAETAWYLEIQTSSMHKKMAFAGSGQRLQTKVLGTTTIKAVKKAAEQKKVRILRQYDDAEITDRSPVQVVDYVNSGESFELPTAPAIAFYTFSGYYIGESAYAVGDSVSISDDTDIIAKYTSDADADCAINATGYTGTVKYNDKVELTGSSDTYAWVEEVDSLGTHFRPFFIGKNVSFFASESTNLKAVTKAEFDAFKFSLPTVNLRKSGVITEGVKTIFNAQIVPGDANVQEYGILVAAPYGETPAVSIDATQVVIENSGKHADDGYQILRAKSTKLVGANQFTIGVNGIPSGYIYRGYLIYADSDGNLHNVYSEAMR